MLKILFDKDGECADLAHCSNFLQNFLPYHILNRNAINLAFKP